MDTQLINDNLLGITEQCNLMDPTISCNSISAKEKADIQAIATIVYLFPF